jgi:hypothetical protein
MTYTDPYIGLAPRIRIRMSVKTWIRIRFTFPQQCQCTMFLFSHQ